MSHADVAEHLDESLGTVKSRIRYGLEKLRSALKGEGARMSEIADEKHDQAIDQLMHELAWGGDSLVGNGLLENSADAELVDELRGALDAFALADTPAVEPPKELRSKVVAAALNADEKPARFDVIPWLAAASFAVMAGASFLFWSSERKDLVARAETSELRVRDLQSTVDQTFKAFIVWDETRGTGVLKVENLPELGDGADYQLWVVAEGYDNPLDGGVFDTTDGRAEMKIVTRKLAADLAPADKVALFAISKERPGGVPISENGNFVLTAAY